MEKDKILARLNEHFRLKPKTMLYAQCVEMLFIYRYAKRRVGSENIEVVLAEIIKMESAIRERDRHKRLHELFSTCQIKDIAECGRYDTTVQHRPPPVFRHNDWEY